MIIDKDQIFNSWKKGRYKNIPILFNPATNEMVGKNQFWDVMIAIALWIDVNLLQIEEFEIEIEE